jgi:hypothetical protein
MNNTACAALLLNLQKEEIKPEPLYTALLVREDSLKMVKMVMNHAKRPLPQATEIAVDENNKGNEDILYLMGRYNLLD